MDGTPYAGTKADGGVGVYLDGASSDNSIQYNVISGCTFSNGIQVNGGTNNRDQNNTLYNNYIGICLDDTDAGLVHDNIVTNNIIYAIDATQVLLYIKPFPSTAYSAGTLDHYLNYNNSNTDVITYYDGSKTIHYTLSQWKAKEGMDSVNDANPFCYKTAIKYSVKTSNKITLSLIDIYRHQVEIIYSGVQQPRKYTMSGPPPAFRLDFIF